MRKQNSPKSQQNRETWYKSQNVYIQSTVRKQNLWHSLPDTKKFPESYWMTNVSR